MTCALARTPGNPDARGASSVSIDGMALKLTNLEIHLVVSAHWESAPLTVPRFAQLAGSVHPCFQATWRSCPMTLSVPFSRSMSRHCSPSASLSQAAASAMTHRAPVRVVACRPRDPPSRTDLHRG